MFQEHTWKLSQDGVSRTMAQKCRKNEVCRERRRMNTHHKHFFLYCFVLFNDRRPFFPLPSFVKFHRAIVTQGNGIEGECCDRQQCGMFSEDGWKMGIAREERRRVHRQTKRKSDKEGKTEGDRGRGRDRDSARMEKTACEGPGIIPYAYMHAHIPTQLSCLDTRPKIGRLNHIQYQQVWALNTSEYLRMAAN